MEARIETFADCSIANKSIKAGAKITSINVIACCIVVAVVFQKAFINIHTIVQDPRPTVT